MITNKQHKIAIESYAPEWKDKRDWQLVEKNEHGVAVYIDNWAGTMLAIAPTEFETVFDIAMGSIVLSVGKWLIVDMRCTEATKRIWS